MNISATPLHLTTAMVSRHSAATAVGDGDGRTGAAALNDGDAAAKAAARTVRPGAVRPQTPPASTVAPTVSPTAQVRPGSVDVKA